MITLTIYEDTGPVVSSRGTTQSVVENIGWRSAGVPDISSSDYVYNPIIRPEGDTPFAYSYKKYNYLKIEGTYPLGSRPRIKISGNYNGSRPEDYEGRGDIRIYYKLTNVYEQPNASFDGNLIYLPPTGALLFPAVSPAGPETATEHLQYLAANTTYFTQYLVTQVFVPQGSTIDFGNIGELNIEWYLDEYEDASV